MALVLALGLWAFTTAPLSAQSVLASVRDADTGAPLQGAVVQVVGADGAVARSALSDAAGRARILGVAAGTWTVRAEMIGFSTAVREGVETVAGTPTVVELALSSRAIELEGLSVEGEERCTVRPEEGLRVADVWDEARKALEATRLTEERGAYAYRVRQYVRDVEESGRVADQRSRASRLYGESPYRSLPAEDLMEGGFVQDPADGEPGDLYYAPDAAVLLSDVFLDAHCMRLRRGDDEDEGLVGLAFEPVRGRRLPGIAGTLWLDPESWELERLEYRYVNLESDVALRDVGGTVAFLRLPDGTWIIPEWQIRMPWMAVQRDSRGGRRIYQHGVRQEGATVLSVREQGGAVVLAAETATVEGVVLDELTGEPVAGVEVALGGTETGARTGPDGAFRFTEVVPGRYDLVVDHPSLVGPGLALDAEPVEAVEGRVASVRLSLPSPLRLVTEACRAEVPDRPGDAAVLVGEVLDRDTGLPLEGATVEVSWDEWRLSGAPGSYLIGQSGQGVRLTTGPEGTWRACAVPAETNLTVTASWGPFTGEPDTVRIPEDRAVDVHEARLGVAAGSAIRGRVVARADGRPVAGAELRLRRVDDPDAAERRLATDGSGGFLLEDAGAGRYVLTVSSLGYAEVTDTVEARGGRINQVTVRLPEEAVEIEGVTVEVEARIPRLDRSGFYERARSGQGVFLDADAIAERPVSRPTQIFERMNGVRVRYTSGQTGSRPMITAGQGCVPALWVDGVRIRDPQPFTLNPSPNRPPLYLDDVVSLNSIEGIEVYRDQAEMPAQYTGTGSECGVVVVWTR